jgi:hypothetical protein
MTGTPEIELLRLALVVLAVLFIGTAAMSYWRIHELKADLAEMRVEVKIARREAEESRAKADRSQEIAHREILRLSVQLAALQRGAVVPDELARYLTVPDIAGFGSKGGVRVYLALCGDLFSIDDLQDIAFRNGIDWDSLAGDNKQAKARELVTWFVSHNKLGDLKSSMSDLRPDMHI